MMKKIVFYIPAILLAILWGWGTIVASIGLTSLLIFAFMALFLMGGILLSKDKWWGGVLGMLPGVHFLYMSTKYTGQVFSERPIGIVILLFYIVCSGYVFYKKTLTRIKID